MLDHVTWSLQERALALNRDEGALGAVVLGHLERLGSASASACEHAATHPGERPAAWWQYQPGIPAHLRVRAERDPVAVAELLADPARPADPLALSLAVWRRGRERRAAWLRSRGHVGDQERIAASGTP